MQRITALLLCITVSLAALATAPGVARPPTQAATPLTSPEGEVTDKIHPAQGGDSNE